MNVEGIGPYEIARILYEDKVETPAVYLGKKELASGKARKIFQTLITGVVILSGRFYLNRSISVIP